MDEHAVVVAVGPSGMWITVRLWTGDTVPLHRGQIPWRGPIKIGDKLDVTWKTIKRPIVVRRVS